MRGRAWFDGKCALADEDAQEAAVRACQGANPGTINVGLPRIASEGNFGLYTALCTGQLERGALYTMILTDPEATLPEEQHMALETFCVVLKGVPGLDETLDRWGPGWTPRVTP